MCVKIVAECKEDVLLETVAIQNTKDRVFLFIRYLYPDKTRPETRIPKKWADLGKAKVGEPSRIFSISGSPLIQKPQQFMACIFFFILSGKLDIFMTLHYNANLG